MEHHCDPSRTQRSGRNRSRGGGSRKVEQKVWLPLTYRLFTEQQTEEMLNDSQLKRNVCPDSFHMQ